MVWGGMRNESHVELRIGGGVIAFSLKFYVMQELFALNWVYYRREYRIRLSAECVDRRQYMASNRRKKRKQRKDQGFFIGVCLLAVICIVAVTFLAARVARMMLTPDQVVQVVSATAVPQVTLVPEPTAAPLSQPTEAPVEAATEAPTEAPTEQPEQTEQPVTAGDVLGASDSTEYIEPFEYLPVYKVGNTTDKKIAITVDDCYQVNNLKTICQLAYDNGGKLTIFPIGENFAKTDMDKIMMTCVQAGFELENHTWSHARIFRLSEEQMASEIWSQSNGLNQLLGVNYHQHFFRFMGGDGEYDQRSHNYLKQLGYKGIAHWTYSGSDTDIEKLKTTLEPGAIYLFHTTDIDLRKLQSFIPYAVSQGYKLATLNDVLGFEENVYEPLISASSSMPRPQPYVVEYSELREGDYSWSIVLLQRKLMELGYLAAEAASATSGNPADGDYGAGTTAAVRAFQADHDLPATGVADVETQVALFSTPAGA